MAFCESNLANGGRLTRGYLGCKVSGAGAIRGLFICGDDQARCDRVLRNMKAAQQMEALELMIASNTSTVAHADDRRGLCRYCRVLPNG